MFAPGNKEWQKRKTQSPGRKPKPIEERYAQAFRACVTYDDWCTIIGRAVTDAKDGNKDARVWLTENLIGTPEQRIRIYGAQGEPLFNFSGALQALTGATPGSTEDSAEPSRDETAGDGEKVG